MHSFALANERSTALPSFGTRRVIGALLLAGSVAACATLALQVPRLPARGSFLPADHPIVLLDEQIAASFGMQNPVVWVVAAREGDIWQAPLLSRVQSMTREAFAIPGVIGTEIVSIASPNVRDLQSTEDLLTAVYLMASVPHTPAGIDALRSRVESDPLYHGTLVSRDGRAAMLVAGFRPDADGAAVAAAAGAIRDRHRDEQAEVYVAGAPILAASVARYHWRSVAVLFVVLGMGAIVLAVLAAASAMIAAGIAATLAVLWALAASFSFDFTLLPWVVYGVVPAALIAPAFAIGGASDPRKRAIVALGLVIGFAGIALTDDVPALTFGIAGVLGVIAAFVVGGLVRAALVGNTAPALQSRIRPLALALFLVVAIGMLRSDVSLQLFGHGVRYLPAAVSADLRGVARHFPPPMTLALRIRGEPGFVTSPQVLNTVDAWVSAARDDPAVAQAMSLADLVKMVHRAFGDERPDLPSIPEDAALVSRYLTLAYSPGFRRFLDRSFSQTAVWIYLSSDRPPDIARVHATLSTGMRERPVTPAEVDLAAGDGAVLLVLWQAIRAMIGRGVLAFVLAGIVVGVLAGRETGSRFALGGACAGACVAGTLGWLDLPVDLVTLPAIVGGVVVGSAYAVLGSTVPLAASLVTMAVASSLVALAGGGALGMVAAILLLAPLAVTAVLSGRDSEQEWRSQRREGAMSKPWGGVWVKTEPLEFRAGAPGGIRPPTAKQE